MKNMHLQNGSYKTINFCLVHKIQTVVQYKNPKKRYKKRNSYKIKQISLLRVSPYEIVQKIIKNELQLSQTNNKYLRAVLPIPIGRFIKSNKVKTKGKKLTKKLPLHMGIRKLCQLFYMPHDLRQRFVKERTA